MKRLLTIGLMLASAFALTNCAEEITAPVQEDVNVDGNIENITPPEEEVDIPFEVFANLGESPETKTYNWGNGTYWHKYEKEGDAASDQISVFHHDGAQFTHNNAFTIQDVATSLFTGSLRNKLGPTNDWYFLYPYNKDYTINSSSGTTAFSIPSINIGSATYTQDSAEGKGKNHIAGGQFPMFGFVNDLDMDEGPDITMNHLAAIAAVKVVNNTGGPITINNAELHAYITVEENKKKVKKALPIVGNFSVGFDNAGKPIEFTAVSGHSNQVKIQLDEPVPVKPNASYTLYFAVSPFKTKLQDLTLYVNGSEKIPVSPDEVVFESGKVTTLKVNVNPLSHIGEDAFKLTYDIPITEDIENNKVLSLFNVIGTDSNGNQELEPITEPTKYINVNNSRVGIYELGGNTPSIIRLEGFAKDVLDALPAGFYASRWNEKPTSMRIRRIDAELPKYHTETKWVIIVPITTTYYNNITGYESIGSKYGAIVEALGVDIPMQNGITMETIEALNIDPSTVTFNGLIQNCDFSTDVLMLDEARTHKMMSNLTGGNIETYLKKFGTAATIAGLYEIVGAAFEGSNYEIEWNNYPAAKATGKAIYDKIKSKLAGMVASKLGHKEIQDSDEFLAGAALTVLGMDANSIMYYIKDMKFTIEIETCPYSEKENNPIVIWGLSTNLGD